MISRPFPSAIRTLLILSIASLALALLHGTVSAAAPLEEEPATPAAGAQEPGAVPAVAAEGDGGGSKWWRTVRGIWGAPITDSGGRPITIGNVVSATVLVFLSIFLARFLSRGIVRRLALRLRLDEGTAATFQVVVFYLLLLLLVLFSLNLANIPITMFAVLAGALAIGVGLGSQNLVSNFISGLTLLVERPIRVGDLINVTDTTGNVEKIGVRSTRIRTGANVHVVVPNSALLDTSVVNWTLSDRLVRVVVKVGIVYGSPTREAERLIRKVLEEHPRAHKEPAPIILFADFGDNALQFEAHFWIEMRNQMDRMTVESDVRFRIDDEFREAGIVVAFPQRDVHLYGARPVEVRLLPEDGR